MSETLRKSGPVTIGGLTFTVQELSVEGEIGLLNHLRRRTKESWGPASFYANTLPVAKWLRENGHGGEAAALSETAARLVATKAPASDEAVWEYLETPDGLADVIFGRTRLTHPDATRQEIRAVINEANAPDVSAQLTDALSAKKAGTPST
jgi:hypothetical protein